MEKIKFNNISKKRAVLPILVTAWSWAWLGVFDTYWLEYPAANLRVDVVIDREQVSEPILKSITQNNRIYIIDSYLDVSYIIDDNRYGINSIMINSFWGIKSRALNLPADGDGRGVFTLWFNVWPPPSMINYTIYGKYALSIAPEIKFKENIIFGNCYNINYIATNYWEITYPESNICSNKWYIQHPFNF